MDRIKIVPLKDISENIDSRLAEIFIDGYYNDMKFFSRDRTKLEKAVTGSFNKNCYHIAFYEDEIAGIIACSNGNERAMTLKKEQFQKSVGRFKTFIGYGFVKKELCLPKDMSSDVGYIECVATHSDFRGKGIATEMTKYIINNLDYREFILDVVLNNTVAYNIYKKIGFVESDRTKDRIYMHYKRDLIKN